MDDADEELLREIYASVEVVKSQQSEIYRRLGRVEKQIEENASQVPPEAPYRPFYKNPFWASLMTGLGVAVAAYLASLFGINMPT
jgi:hypothetical protein